MENQSCKSSIIKDSKNARSHGEHGTTYLKVRKRNYEYLSTHYTYVIALFLCFLISTANLAQNERLDLTTYMISLLYTLSDYINEQIMVNFPRGTY